jgi:hypothetical protein
MAEEKKEKWMNFLALTTVIFAVCATLSTSKGGGYGSKALLNQSKESDSWSAYQAKSIKQSLTENQKENIELQQSIVAKSALTKADEAKYQELIDKYSQKIKRYKIEKDSISAEAISWKKKQSENQEHGAQFGLAVIFLQIAIVLSALAGIMKKKLVWYLSIGIGLIGIFYFADGFFLFHW